MLQPIATTSSYPMQSHTRMCNGERVQKMAKVLASPKPTEQQKKGESTTQKRQYKSAGKIWEELVRDVETNFPELGQQIKSDDGKYILELNLKKMKS